MEGVGSRTRAKRPNLEGDGDSAMDVKMKDDGDASRDDESSSAMDVGQISTPGQVSEASAASTFEQIWDKAVISAATAAQQREGEERKTQAKKKLEDDRKKLEQALWEDPLNIVPEVPMEVLVKFLNPVDKSNLNQASRNAGKVLEKTSHKWRLREALLIPEVQKYLSNKDVLNLRVVCGDWKEAVQHYLDTERQVKPDYSSYKSITASSTLCHVFREDNSDDFKRFTASCIEDSEKVEQLLTWTTGNPFIGRSVVFSEEQNIIIYLDEDEDEPAWDYWEEVLQLLDRMGAELRSIVLKSPWRQARVFLETIHQCLEKTPNLTGLSCDLRNVELERLPYAGPCLPPLPYLTRLHLNLEKCTEFQPFTPHLQQLTSLAVLDDGAFMDWYSPSVHTAFPNLVHLSVNVKNIANLAKVQSIAGPLREVKIYSEFSLVRLIAPLNVLATFRDTLRVVALQQTFSSGNRNANRSPSGEDPVRVDLPHLEVLSINLGECGSTKLDTLLKLSQPPKYLELVVHYCNWEHPRRSARRNGTLKIYGLLDSMYQSNVWELWPDLQVVCVRREAVHGSEETKTCYTRKAWEAFQAEKLRKLQEKKEAKLKMGKRKRKRACK